MLKTGYDRNDEYKAVMWKTQSWNHLEAIFMSKSSSTHVTHAGLELAMVAEDDLKLVTLSLISQAWKLQLCTITTVFMRC